MIVLGLIILYCVFGNSRLFEGFEDTEVANLNNTISQAEEKIKMYQGYLEKITDEEVQASINAVIAKQQKIITDAKEKLASLVPVPITPIQEKKICNLRTDIINNFGTDFGNIIETAMSEQLCNNDAQMTQFKKVLFEIVNNRINGFSRDDTCRRFPITTALTDELERRLTQEVMDASLKEHIRSIAKKTLPLMLQLYNQSCKLYALPVANRKLVLEPLIDKMMRNLCDVPYNLKCSIVLYLLDLVIGPFLTANIPVIEAPVPALPVPSLPVPTPVPTPVQIPISTDARCGPMFNTRCPPNNCCSTSGWCGTGDDHCKTFRRTDTQYHGDIIPISKDARCGPMFNTRCPPNNCCSTSGWCGTGVDHCKTYRSTDTQYHGDGV